MDAGIDILLEFARRPCMVQEWAALADLGSVPSDAVHAPWSHEQVYRLNLRQGEERARSYYCPRCGTELFATRDGWICARNNKRCRFRQSWAKERHVNHPFMPPQRCA